MPEMRALSAIVLALGATSAQAADLVTCIGGERPLAQALQAIGAQPAKAQAALDALKPGAVALIVATPERLTELAQHPEAIERCAAAGGWVVLSGVTPAGLADFDRIVGVPHLMRPFRSEVVAIDPSNPLVRGISGEDVAMRTDGGNPWAAPVMVSENAYGGIVDLDNLAPFAEIPKPDWFKHEDGENDRNPFNLVDGFTEADGGWRRAFVFYRDRSRMDFALKLPRPSALSAVEWTGSMVYPGIEKVEITFDGAADGKIEFAAPQGAVPKRIPLDPPRTAGSVGFRIVSSTDNGRHAVGVDEIRLIAARDADFRQRVHPLTSIGAIVAYPRGAGGVLLCQLHFDENDDQQTAERKQRVLHGLLGNLGVAFGMPGSGMSAPVAAEAIGDPIELVGAAPLGADWLGDAAHSFAIAIGEHGLCGLRFRVGGALRAGDPRSIAVGRKAAALAFLHAAAVPGGFDGRRIARYRVAYADGRVVDVPVVDGLDVADALQRSPRALQRAQLAWIGAGGRKDLAVAYARQWDNPTPEVAIDRVELVGESPDATLALLGLTVVPPPPHR
jgi:hypothetical protein